MSTLASADRPGGLGSQLATVGILECGAPPDALVSRFGTYGAMVKRLLGPDRDTVTFDVTRGELPASATEHRGYVLTGSPAGVYENVPWIPGLIRFLQQARGRSSGSFALGFGIVLLPLSGCAPAACVCKLLSPRADGSACRKIVAAAAGVCRSTQTGLAAHSSPAPFPQTRPRSPRGYADAVHRARGA